jgi:hypothetical protein
MNFILIVLILGCVSFVALSQNVYPEPPPTFQAKEFTTWNNKKVGNSRRGEIHIPFTNPTDGSNDFVSMTRVDLLGNAYDRGFAHGALLTKEIIEFAVVKLDKYFMDEVLNIEIDTSNVPPALQKILMGLKVKGAKAAPGIFHQAMRWVWESEAEFVPQVILDEINGIAAGMCSTLGNDCDVNEWVYKIQELNMLPELIRMACTAFGAWGKATPDNLGLVQVRALDFGTGPFANYTVVAVHREDPAKGPESAFVSIAFPAFVGAITGVSQSGIGISEKVWMTYDPISLQPGSYNGLADVFVLRTILENSKTRAEAEAYLLSLPRTFAIWIGIGDYETQQFDLVGYSAKDSITYTDVTAPSMTGQPYLESIAYVDKHPQPSGDGPTGTLPTALTDFWGNITMCSSKVVTQHHQTGDLHIASYDFTQKLMSVAIGRINSKGDYGPEGGDMKSWMAYNRPYAMFSLEDLWNGV